MPAATAKLTSSSSSSEAAKPPEPRLTRWRQQADRPEVAEIGFRDPSAAVTITSDAYALALDRYVAPRLLPEDEKVDENNQRPREKLIALQSWEGTVLEVEDDSFVARLIDVNGEHLDEEVSLATEELCDFDLELLEPGAIFYWTIGYRYQLGGARERVSRIRLRRLPAWTKSQLDEARERAAALERDLAW
jgi:hypothetical protein